MKHPTTCKFCKAPVVLEIDADYDALGDPHKLIPFAACNRCADMRVKRRWLESAICESATMILQAKERNAVADRQWPILETLTKKYTAMIAEWVGSNLPWWEQCIVDLIVDKPQHWHSALKQCWKMYEQKPL